MLPFVIITGDMIDTAVKIAPQVQVKRTRTSLYDSVYGIIGEYCFAEWFFGNWLDHFQIDNKGKVDFLDRIEVKTSAFPFSSNLHLLVREDYAKKRKPDFYVQTIINLASAHQLELSPGMECILAGYSTAEEIDKAPLKDFGSKFGGRGGYRCRYIPIRELKPIEGLKNEINLS